MPRDGRSALARPRTTHPPDLLTHHARSPPPRSPRPVITPHYPTPESIRYLSLHDNRDLRYFRGHRARVTGIEMCPFDDSFLSTSRDGTLRMWDLRSHLCQGILHAGIASTASSASTGVSGLSASSTGNSAMACYDPEGVIFAVYTADSGSVHLYDRKMAESGPFKTVLLATSLSSVDSLSFSPDGQLLVLSGVLDRASAGSRMMDLTGSGAASTFTDGASVSNRDAMDGRVLILDAFDLDCRQELQVPVADTSFVIGGLNAAAATSSSSKSSSVPISSLLTAGQKEECAAAAASALARPRVLASFSPDGTHVSAATSSGAVIHYTTSTGQNVATWSHQAPFGKSFPTAAAAAAAAATGGAGAAAQAAGAGPAGVVKSGVPQAIVAAGWNPCRAVYAAADASQLALWVPPPASSAPAASAGAAAGAGAS